MGRALCVVVLEKFEGVGDEMGKKMGGSVEGGRGGCCVGMTGMCV